MFLFIYLYFYSLFFFFKLDLNPASEKKNYRTLGYDAWLQKYENSTLHELPFGFPEKTLSARLTNNIALETYMTSYRYLIVIAGLVSADRLNTFLSHSGAVILLQETDFVYHYSSLLKPWVHYGESIPD